MVFETLAFKRDGKRTFDIRSPVDTVSKKCNDDRKGAMRQMQRPQRYRMTRRSLVALIPLLVFAAAVVGIVPAVEAAGPSEYAAPEWWPLRGSHLIGCTNGNGCGDGYHGYWALDINATRDTEIYAAGAGQVELAVGNQGGNCEFAVYRSVARCPDGSRGNLVRIKHDATGEVTSYYLHFTSVFVKTGDWVDQNTLLGTAGDSGLSGPGYVHLHFEVRHGAFSVDPVPLRACHGDQLKSYPGEFQGKTSWSQVTAYQYAVRSDGTSCAAGTTTTLGSGTSTTVAGGTTTTLAPGPTTTVAGGTTTTFAGRPGAPVLVGGAAGYAVPRFALLGGVPSGVPVAPTPNATLAADASNSPQTARAESASAIFGPARIFTSGPIAVRTEGSLEAGGSVRSSADIQNVNASGTEVFTASRLQSTCTASASGVTGSTTITGGVLQTSEGDPDVGGDETYVTLPVHPAPNAEYPGRIETVGDSFKYTFNEQVPNPDGSLTVYAAHLELLGPTAFGDVYIGRVDCGVIAARTTTTIADSTTTTLAGPTTTTTTTTTTVAGGGTSTTTQAIDTLRTAASGTTTTLAGSTTTTTSTTVGGPATTSPGRAGGGPSGTVPQARSALARTGSTPQSLLVLSLLMLVLGALAHLVPVGLSFRHRCGQ